MLDPAHPHPLAAFWLDVADKLLKLAAVLIGAAWTWMHYHRSRTYAPKLELHLEGSTFRKDALYMEALLQIKNVGASQHTLHGGDTTCEINAIYADGSERQLRLTRVFDQQTWIESGEIIKVPMYLQVEEPRTDLIWVRVNLRVISKEVEWNDGILLKVS